MCFCGRPAGRRLNVLLLVFVAAIAVAGAKATGEDHVPAAGDVPGIGAKLQAWTCRPIDSCRGAHANQKCCKDINTAIVTDGGCGCVCKVLKRYRATKLPAACTRVSACPKCVNCPCS